MTKIASNGKRSESQPRTRQDKTRQNETKQNKTLHNMRKNVQ